MAEAYIESIVELDENAILTELNSVAQELGLINEIFNTSRIYLYYAVFARVWGHLSQIMVQYFNDVDIDNTTDEALLEKQIKPFVNKRYARVAKVILEFSRRPEYTGTVSDIIISRDTEVMTEGDDPLIFRTAESRILFKNSNKVLIPAYSVEFGSLNNVSANTLTYFDDYEFFSQLQVTNPKAAFGGMDEETAFDTRNRISTFRFAHDSTREAIQEMLFESGVSYYGFNIVEYWGGFGTALICIDVDSEDEFSDIVAQIEAQKSTIARYYYAMAEPVYVNINVTTKLVSQDTYTNYQKDELEQHIKTAIETFFASQMYVGKKLSINRLESYILQYLFDERYDIYEVEVDVQAQNNVNVDPITGQLKISEYQKLSPNIIYSQLEFTLDE